MLKQILQLKYLQSNTSWRNGTASNSLRGSVCFQAYWLWCSGLVTVAV